MTDKMIEAFDGTRKAGVIASGALDEVAKIIKSTIINDVPINLQESDSDYIRNLVKSISENKHSPSEPIINEIFEIVYASFIKNDIKVTRVQDFSNSIQVKEKVNDSTTTTVTKTAVGKLYELYGSARLIVNLNINDAVYGNSLLNDRISKFFEFRDVYIIYKGDRRAIPTSYRKYSINRPLYPNLKDSVERIMLREINNIIKSRYEN